jgi:hypothetical protein
MVITAASGATLDVSPEAAAPGAADGVLDDPCCFAGEAGRDFSDGADGLDWARAAPANNRQATAVWIFKDFLRRVIRINTES